MEIKFFKDFNAEDRKMLYEFKATVLDVLNEGNINEKQPFRFRVLMEDSGDIDLVITDLKMDGISGEDVVRHIVTETPGIPVIVLTGHGSIEEAVELMTKGAFYFLTKPLDLDQLNLIVKRALENRELSISHTMLKKQLEEAKSCDRMIGKSSEMQKP